MKTEKRKLIILKLQLTGPLWRLKRVRCECVGFAHSWTIRSEVFCEAVCSVSNFGTSLFLKFLIWWALIWTFASLEVICSVSNSCTFAFQHSQSLVSIIVGAFCAFHIIPKKMFMCDMFSCIELDFFLIFLCWSSGFKIVSRWFWVSIFFHGQCHVQCW